jgi:hypothetical protein
VNRDALKEMDELLMETLFEEREHALVEESEEARLAAREED